MEHDSSVLSPNTPQQDASPLDSGRFVDPAPDATLATPDAGDAQAPLPPLEHHLHIVAHQDDDLGLMNPTLLSAIARGAVIDTVFLTAGNAGYGCLDYAQGRENGIKAAYAQMAGRANQWHETQPQVAGHRVRRLELDGAPIRLTFVGLRDDARYQLRGLWQGNVERIETWEGDTRRPRESYSRDELISLLIEFLIEIAPSHVHINDASQLYPQFWPFDHPGHVHTGLFSLLALEHYGAVLPTGFEYPELRMYRAYNIQFEPENLSTEDAARSWEVFETYAAHDAKMCDDWATIICDTPSECTSLSTFYAPFRGRQYPIAMVRGVDTLKAPLGTCLERSGTRVVAGTCPGASVLWRLERDDSLRDSTGKSCVTAPEHLTKPLFMAPCTGALGQRFRVTDQGQLRGPEARCVEVVGAELHLASCTDSASQLGFALGP